MSSYRFHFTQKISEVAFHLSDLIMGGWTKIPLYQILYSRMDLMEYYGISVVEFGILEINDSLTFRESLDKYNSA